MTCKKYIGGLLRGGLLGANPKLGTQLIWSMASAQQSCCFCIIQIWISTLFCNISRQRGTHKVIIKEQNLHSILVISTSGLLLWKSKDWPSFKFISFKKKSFAIWIWLCFGDYKTITKPTFFLHQMKQSIVTACGKHFWTEFVC